MVPYIFIDCYRNIVGDFFSILSGIWHLLSRLNQRWLPPVRISYLDTSKVNQCNLAVHFAMICHRMQKILEN